VKAATQRLSLDPADAPRIVAERDANRARYHREYYDRDSNDPIHYHMVLNTGRLGFDGAAQVILDRARALGWAKP
jgi:cytidylate kinase